MKNSLAFVHLRLMTRLVVGGLISWPYQVEGVTFLHDHF